MQKNIVITLNEHPAKNLSAIVDDLKREGLKVHKAFGFGVITGMFEENLLDNLFRHKEVKSITEDKTIQIPNQDSGIQ